MHEVKKEFVIRSFVFLVYAIPVLLGRRRWAFPPQKEKVGGGYSHKKP